MHHPITNRKIEEHDQYIGTRLKYMFNTKTSKIPRFNLLGQRIYKYKNTSHAIINFLLVPQCCAQLPYDSPRFQKWHLCIKEYLNYQKRLTLNIIVKIKDYLNNIL